MNITFSAEHTAFRDEIRRFLDESLTDELRDAQTFCPGIFLDYEHNIVWHRILHAKGWIAPSWPKQYGGTGWDLVQRYLWSTETVLAGAPSLAPMGLGMCGPMLIGCGSKAQQEFYLPRILSGEDYWCQGYSEPASGSDLASLKLRADTDGDHFVLNGSKIWTTHAHYANRMFLLVRSDDSGRPQQGITFLLMDMDSPGLTVDPIVFASGTHEVNQVFFDDVRVPKSNIVGEENEGWKVAKYLLEFERGGGGAAASARANLTKLKRLASDTQTPDGPLIETQPFKSKLDQAEIQLESFQYLEFRIMAALSSGENPGPESSIMKNISADLGQHITELAVETVGYFMGVDQPEARTVGSNLEPVGPKAGMTALPRYFNLRASSIAGGSNEVQKNIVAKAVLGL